MKALFTICLVFGLFEINAQQIDLQTISSLGGYEQTTNTEWTTGELVIQGNDQLTQGFQQGKFLVTSIFETPAFAEVSVYPNPVVYKINIEGDQEENLQITILNVHGRRILQSVNVNLPYEVDFSGFPPGNYFLHLSKSNNRYKVFKINKIK